MIKKIFALGLLVLSANSFAAGSYEGKITQVMLGQMFGNNVFLVVDGTIKTRSSCATNPYYGFVFDGTTELGKNMLSTVLAAYASGKTVSIGGADNCSLYENVESINWMRAQ